MLGSMDDINTKQRLWDHHGVSYQQYGVPSPRLGRDASGQVVWDSFLDVPETSGSHVVLLGGDTILMSADAPASKKLFEERGLHVIDVDISEFIKLEGCVTCLSVRLRGI